VKNAQTIAINAQITEMYAKNVYLVITYKEVCAKAQDQTAIYKIMMAARVALTDLD